MKGIPFVEQHVEKIVVGVAAAILVGAVVYEVTSGRSVKVGNDTLTPSNAGEALDARARAIETRLNDARVPPELAADQAPEIADQFMEQLKSGIVPAPTLPRIEPTLAGRLLESETVTDTYYRLPVVPVVTMVPDVMQTSDAIVEETFQTPEHKELAGVFKTRSSTAVDVTWLTPAGWIDLRALREELRRDDPNAKPPLAAAPSSWYQEGTFVVDLVFEREELLPDGTWGNRQVVAPVPDRLTFRPRIPNADVDLRNEVLAVLAQPERQLEILQPDFYPTKNDSFISPVHASSTPERSAEPREIQRLRQRLSRAQAQLTKAEEALKEAGGPVADPPPKEGGGGASGRGDGDKNRRGGGGGSRGGGGPPGGGMGGGGSGGGGAGFTDRPADGQQSESARRILTRRVKNLQEDVERFKSELEAKAPSPSKEGDAEKTADAVRTIVDLSTTDRLLVWTHDLNVRPEVSYRYRCIVAAFNPFFGRQRQLVNQQASLADSLVIRSAPGPWSNPVEVTPSSTFFVTSASAEGGALGLGTAEFEVYRLIEGVRRRQQFTVQPGERIGRLVEPRRADGGDAIDFTTDWFLVAIVEDPSLERSELDRSKSYIVVVRQMNVTEDGTMLRSPTSDSESGDRRRLMEETVVEQAAASPS